MLECPNTLFRDALMYKGDRMTHIDFFTEEESARVVLDALLPRMLPSDSSYNIYVYQGKRDLLKKLPNRLRAYRHPPLNTHKLIILIDRDNQDCLELKRELESLARKAGVVSKTENSERFQVVTRIVIEELESWYFGDTAALHKAYPCVSKTLSQKKGYGDPDKIVKPSEKLHRLLKSEYPSVNRLLKVEVAERVSVHMSPDINTSESFQAFRKGILACCKL